MPESETSVVFRILGVLAQARGHHTLAFDEIVRAVHLAERRVEGYMALLVQAGAVRAESKSRNSSYALTRYGLARLGNYVNSASINER